MSKPYIDHAQTFAAQERAMQIARERLEARGIFWPIPDSSLSAEENYQRLMEFSEIEAAEIVKVLREPIGGQRPLAKDTVTPKKEWGNSYYD